MLNEALVLIKTIAYRLTKGGAEGLPLEPEEVVSPRGVKSPRMRPPAIRYPRFFVGALVATAILTALLGPSPARASIDMAVGARGSAVNASSDACSASANAALTTAMGHPAVEAGTGTGQWLGFGANDSNGNPTASAAIHCYPVGTGYVVTVTCATERGAGSETAAALCARIEKAFVTPTAGFTWQ